MYRHISLFILVFIPLTQLNAQNILPKVISGKIERIENFKSKYVTERNIDIWLPEGYSDSTQYAVLFMHDGQMLYDPAQSWNSQAWDVDDVVTDLRIKDKVKDFIIVGIWNGGVTRHQDYFPRAPFKRLAQAEKDTVIAHLQRAGRTKEIFQPQSDKYLRFITKELKPYIDKTYSVNTGRESTFIAGSSMGALISLYAICEYPNIFGGAACLSTHWVGAFSLENNPVPNSILEYLSKKLPSPGNHKIYFDCGDQTLDALYPEIQTKVDNLMKSKGHTNNNWITKYYPGEGHSEKSWNKRLNVPIEFLLGK